MFSSVVKHSFIWVLLAMVALFDLELEQLNVKTAFPYSKLEERIYMHQLGGFIAQGKEYHVCLLKSHCMAWSNHRDSGIKGLMLLCLDMVTLCVTVIVVYILESSQMVHLYTCCMLMTCWLLSITYLRRSTIWKISWVWGENLGAAK